MQSPIEGTLDGWGTVTATLCKTLKTMQSMKTSQTFGPQELLATFAKKSAQCMDGGQHDSHELLRHLLELVRNEDLRVSLSRESRRTAVIKFIVKFLLLLEISSSYFGRDRSRENTRDESLCIGRQDQSDS